LPSSSTAAKTTANACCIISHLACRWRFAALLLLQHLLLLPREAAISKVAHMSVITHVIIHFLPKTH
jgi:hypothetical protein